MKQFHEDIASLEAAKCIICQECFPSLKTNEMHHCTRCNADKSVPKLYSKENNMHPGPVPRELMVSTIYEYAIFIYPQYYDYANFLHS